MRLKLDPAKLGLKPGDKVGVQVAYCVHGSKAIAEPEEEMAMRELMKAEDEFGWDLPLVSNRLEFIYRAGDFAPATEEEIKEQEELVETD